MVVFRGLVFTRFMVRRRPMKAPVSLHGVLVAVIAPVLLILSSWPGSAQQKDPAARAQGLGVEEHQVGGVDVVLLDVRRTTDDVLTVKWEYRNKTDERKRLTDQSTGWIDPYRLAADAYVLDNVNKIKYEVALDEKRHPIAGRHGGQNSWIFVGPKQTVATWAKFQAPPGGIEKVTVFIPGAAPFENVPISK